MQLLLFYISLYIGSSEGCNSMSNLPTHSFIASPYKHAISTSPFLFSFVSLLILHNKWNKNYMHTYGVMNFLVNIIHLHCLQKSSIPSSCSFYSWCSPVWWVSQHAYLYGKSTNVRLTGSNADFKSNLFFILLWHEQIHHMPPMCVSHLVSVYHFWLLVLY